MERFKGEKCICLELEDSMVEDYAMQNRKMNQKSLSVHYRFRDNTAVPIEELAFFLIGERSAPAENSKAYNAHLKAIQKFKDESSSHEKITKCFIKADGKINSSCMIN